MIVTRREKNKGKKVPSWWSHQQELTGTDAETIRAHLSVSRQEISQNKWHAAELQA